MSDPPPEPGALQVADLDEDRLRELLADVAALGEGLVVRRKRRGEVRAEPVISRGAQDLAAAAAELTGGGLAGLQLTYRYRGELFIDTLIPSGNGARLVRSTGPRP